MELELGLAARQGAACALSGQMPTGTDRGYFMHAFADATKGIATSRCPSRRPQACPYPAAPAVHAPYACSVSAAIHSKIVRVRSVKDRRNREPPRRPGFGARPER